MDLTCSRKRESNYLSTVRGIRQRFGVADQRCGEDRLATDVRFGAKRLAVEDGPVADGERCAFAGHACSARGRSLGHLSHGVVFDGSQGTDRLAERLHDGGRRGASSLESMTVATNPAELRGGGRWYVQLAGSATQTGLHWHIG